MAFRGSNLQWMVRQMGGGRRSFATSTTPKMKPASPALDAHHSHSHFKIGEKAPIQIIFGMVAVVMALGAHTAFQQLVRSPSVHVSKKRRESVTEVEDPDLTIDSADKFINRSMLRKVAHIQENKATLSDPVHPDPFTRPRTAETLKTVGIEPSRH